MTPMPARRRFVPALEEFIQESIEPKSLVHCDGSLVCQKLDDIGYGHKRTGHPGSELPADESMPAVHRVAALLQRGVDGGAAWGSSTKPTGLLPRRTRLSVQPSKFGVPRAAVLSAAGAGSRDRACDA